MLIVRGAWHSGGASDSGSGGWELESLCPHTHTQIQLLIHRASYSCSSSSRGYGATAARLTPDQKVGSSNLSALIFRLRLYQSLILRVIVMLIVRGYGLLMRHELI